MVRSRLLVSVWSPQYFRSSWCLAETYTMSMREQLLGLTSVRRPDGLIYPVIFSGSRHFPPEALARQAFDLRDLNIPYPWYRDTAEYLHLHRAVGTIAGELAMMLDRVPPWQPGWPVSRPKCRVAEPTDLPGL